MKVKFLNRFLLLFFAVSLVFQADAQQNTTFQEPALSTPDSWSLILLPDPQTYVKFDYNQPLLELLTAWIVRYQEKLNIQMVLCTGDMVEQNDFPNPDGIAVNQPSKSQWESSANAFCRLDGKIPYVLATGNHDYGYKSAENRQTNYDRYFPVDKNPLSQKLLRDVGVDVNNKPSLTNATYEFITPHGKKFLILVLEFAPRDEILEWAKNTVGQEKYAGHTVILLTHSYLNANNEHIEKEGYTLPGPNYGAAVWQKLVQPSKNILMVISGHIGAPNDPKAHLAFRTDVNSAGRKVQQMTFNAQALGGGWNGNGGDGWLRILEFLPDNKTIKVKTFSPLFAVSPTTRQYAWRTEPYDEFTIILDE
ncbi:MAG: metallophosphoesterase [Tannerella sp.]|jgi:hypothetical protein|nr:metallophosphoesterase [Tannerella sp.]